MHIYKLSSTRAVGHFAAYDNELFTGSSHNRRIQQQNKKQASQKNSLALRPQAAQIVRHCFDGRLLDYNSWTVKADQFAFLSSPLQVLGRVPVAVCPKKRRIASPRSLSGRSKNKIRDKIESLYNATPSTEFTFLTLTFINDVTDKDAQKCLNKFLTVCRKRWGKFMYLWVAERQKETGRIHFHLITNKRLPIVYFNSLWCLQQYNSGLSLPVLSKSDFMLYYHTNKVQKVLNPVDVRRVDSLSGLSLYLTKYITKNNDTFDCSRWHCCRAVSGLFTHVLTTEKVINDLNNPDVNYYASRQTGEIYTTSAYVSKHAIVINVLNKRHFSKNLRELNMLNRWLISGFVPDAIPTINYPDYSKQYLKPSTRPTTVMEDFINLNPSRYALPFSHVDYRWQALPISLWN